MKTIIISDLHLGSPNSNSKAINNLLDLSFDRLILNGDIVNSLNFNKFKPKDWAIFQRIKELKSKKEVIFIQGNHDSHLNVILNEKFHSHYTINHKTKLYCIIHGDFFDPTINWPIVTDIADWCYQTSQKINKKSAKVFKKLVKKFGGVLDLVRDRSIYYASHSNFDGIITGHTHFADNLWSKGIHYLNTGCWTEEKGHYIEINDNNITLQEL